MRKILSLLGLIPEIVTLVSAIAIVIDLGQSGILGVGRWFGQTEILALISTAFAGLSVSILTRNLQFDRILTRLSVGDFETVRVLESNEYPDFNQPFLKARTIDILTISGTKNANLGNQQTLESLFSNLHNKRLRILVADPNSKAVSHRYESDEPATAEVGLDGLRKRLRFLKDQRSSLPDNERKRVSIRVYSAYPTLNFVAVDGTYYWSVFGYKLRGSDCPRMVTRASGLFPTFLARQFENLWQDSVAIEDWTDAE